jgi:hypothetical protein
MIVVKAKVHLYKIIGQIINRQSRMKHDEESKVYGTDRWRE